MNLSSQNIIMNYPFMCFSLKMKAVAAKKLANRKVKKFKLKTHAAFAKRFRIKGT